MDFTLSVKIQDPGADFELGSLWNHKECGGGKVVMTTEKRKKSNTMGEDHLVFTCKRCGIVRSFPASDDNRLFVALFALEGGNLKIGEVSFVSE